MFKRDVKSIHDVLVECLKWQGLSTPLLQKRLVESWPEVAGAAIAQYTTGVRITGQTLVVSLSAPVLRTELSMQKSVLVDRLNARVGERIITDIRFC